MAKGGADGRHVLVQRTEEPDAVVDTATGGARELAGVRGFGAVAPGGAEVAYVRRLGQAGCDVAIADTLSGETRSLRSIGPATPASVLCRVSHRVWLHALRSAQATIAAMRLTRRIPVRSWICFTADRPFAQRCAAVIRYAFATGARRTLARGCTTVSAG